MDVIKVIYYIHDPVEYRRNQVIFAVSDVSGLKINSDKTSKFFCINSCNFFYQTLFFCTTVAQSSSFIKTVDVFDLYIP